MDEPTLVTSAGLSEDTKSHQLTVSEKLGAELSPRISVSLSESQRLSKGSLKGDNSVGVEVSVRW